MKYQLHNRLCAPFIHDVLERFSNTTLTAKEATVKLGLSRSRFYALHAAYLRAKALGMPTDWMPGRSGGDHLPNLSESAQKFLRRALTEGYNHAFAASELQRLFKLKTTRWSVRRFAQAEGLAQSQCPIRTPAHTRRWQRQNVGELWQLDATPHHWFGPEHPAQPLFDMIDDASRLQVGIRLCRAETLADYIFFLEKAFKTHGLPLSLYVDNASFFRSPKDGNLTALGQRLAFYGVSLLYATSPQSKGKVERIHHVWQDRLPPFFRLNRLTPEHDPSDLNATLETLAEHRNTHEHHREIDTFPRAAWNAAIASGHDKHRPLPRDAWWPYVWSVWHPATVGTHGRVYHRDLFFPTSLRKGEKVILCEHATGHYFVIQNPPQQPTLLPIIQFTNLPKSTPKCPVLLATKIPVLLAPLHCLKINFTIYEIMILSQIFHPVWRFVMHF